VADATDGVTMQRYPNISDHGLIGDLQTAALVSTDGTVNWFCCPRFDSPSVFASLLDADKGGYFRIAPENECVTRQLYFPDTAVLITRFMSADGVGEIYDFMPIAGRRATTRHRLVRQCRVVRGTMKFILELQPRFDYARATHTAQLTNDGAVFRAEGTISAVGGAGAAGELTLHISGSSASSLEEQGVTMERDGDGLRPPARCAPASRGA
jgi:GH15 family glucan-1,4-alpha-glucosidase